MGNDLIRMSGMNSGLDTESIIKALTANSKLKVTKQERNVLKYEATQEAYRDIIGKMQNIKNKYFDLLNKDSYLSGTSMWSKYASKTYDVEGNEKNIKGLSVSTTINSKPGDYDFEIETTATQTKLTGTTLGGSARLDLASLTGKTEADGTTPKTLGITVTVGDVEKNITFKSGATSGETIDNLNKELEAAFGESNESTQIGGADQFSGAEAYKNYQGMVYADRSGKIVSRDSKGVTTSGVGTMESSNELSLAAAKAGTNTLTLQAGDKTFNVSFQTIEKTYFDGAISAGLINTANGEVKPFDEMEDGERVWYKKAKEAATAALGADASEEEIETKANEIEAEWSNAASIYKAAVDDYKESVRYAAFKQYMDGDDGTKKDALYADALAEQKNKQMGKWLAADEAVNAKYEEYKDGLAEGVEADDIYTWAKAQNDDSTIQEAVTKYDHKFEGIGNGEEDYSDTYYSDGYKAYKDNYASSVLTDEQKAAYETYKSGAGESALSIYDWAKTDTVSGAKTTLETAETSQDNPLKSESAWKAEKIESDSWHLNRSSFDNSESDQFAAYKRSVFNEETAVYDLSAENIYDHFNESAIKNSIGSLEANGVKFTATYDKATDKVTIGAENSSDGSPVSFSITIGKNSANKADTFGLSTASDATTQISQVTNSTKLSDIMDSATGTYDFTINGQSFSFDGNTSVNDMMKKVNASSAGVKMQYSSLKNQFTLTTSAYGVDAKLELGDTTGLLGAIGLDSANTVQGTNLKVNVNGEEYESAGNTIEADGTTFTITGDHKAGEQFTVSISQDTTAIADVIKDFVKDYNQLIEDVYKMLDEKPEKDYYFLADQDKEDLELSDKQEEKWEEKAKKGLLYHDSTTTQIMSGLRTALMGSVEGLDGNTFSLLDLGIKTVSDYNQHGKLTLDVSKLNDAIETHADDIMKLFSDSENGIMKKFSEALDSGVNTTGDNKGSLIRKAGLATGSSATDNEIYKAIKRTKTKISDLNRRYESEQDRLWKRYSNMESLLGQMNSQQASFSSYFMQ